MRKTRKQAGGTVGRRAKTYRLHVVLLILPVGEPFDVQAMSGDSLLTEICHSIYAWLLKVWGQCQQQPLPGGRRPVGLLRLELVFAKKPRPEAADEWRMLEVEITNRALPVFLGTDHHPPSIDLPFVRGELTFQPLPSLDAPAAATAEESLASGQKKTDNETPKEDKPSRRETFLPPPPEQRPDQPQEPPPIRPEEVNETKQPGFVEKVRRRQGPGRPKQQRSPIPWQEILQLAKDTADQQALAVERFQALLGSLVGKVGASPKENKDLTKAIKDLADRLGVDLAVNSHTVNVNWNSGVFLARSKGIAQETRDSSAGFPHLTAQPRPPTEEVNIASWAARAKVDQKPGGVGGPK